MAKRRKVTAARVMQIKREVAGKIRQSWGEDALVDAVRAPCCRSQMRAHSERKACRAKQGNEPLFYPSYRSALHADHHARQSGR